MDTEATKTKVRIFDMIIAGGGPGGTAAAFRARELGMSVLILEYDDLMKRIRDYSKSKLILPGFGGGDKMKFPSGGDLIASLRFEPIDKDDLVWRWKELHKEHKVLSRVGVELTGLKERKDGLLQVVSWNHQQRKEQYYLTRNLVLALGNGVPRRLDITGNTEGIAFRMNDPGDYVGAPACVIGGGTSAAEAVIAISHAKVEARDPSAVYWSYRGTRLPRVSKALAEVFFEAYVGNGNIRYYPNSEPVAVVTGSDHQEYLALRIDRRHIEGRPIETTHLEFPKQQCIACIGEDLPEALLGNLGIVLVHGGPRMKKRVVVNRFLESRVPGVYMIGDLLSQAFLQTDDFEADPAEFAEIKHRGNIKTAMRDGVFVAEVVKQRLDGRDTISVQVGDLDDLPGGQTPRPHADSLIAKLPPAAPSSAEPALHRLLPNGEVESEHALAHHGETVIGKGDADISFPDDPLMARRHAVITAEGGTFSLKHGADGADIFRVLTPATKTELQIGDLLRVGMQFLLIGGQAGAYTVEHYTPQGERVGVHTLTGKAMVFGREAPDVTLDPNDRSLSRRHLTLNEHEGRVVAKDLESANHSFLRMRKAGRLRFGDRFQVGSELFVLVAGAQPVASVAVTTLAAPAVKPVAAPPMPTPSPTATAPAASGGEPSVTFEGLGTFPVTPGQTLCDVAEAHGIKLKAECHMGVCGSDPVRILSGRENLAGEPTPGEQETLEDICDLEPGPCRLACMARIKGPVTVQIIQV